MALNLVRPDSVAMQKDITPESVVREIQKNILLSLRHNHVLSKDKQPKKKKRDCIVERSNGRNLAVKISNWTWNLIPLNSDEDEVQQVIEAAEQLTQYQDSLFRFKLWTNKITGVEGGEKKFPRPEDTY